jgi:hypothetical protein
MYMYLKDLQIVYICYFASNFDEFFLWVYCFETLQ